MGINANDIKGDAAFNSIVYVIFWPTVVYLINYYYFFLTYNKFIFINKLLDNNYNKYQALSKSFLNSLFFSYCKSFKGGTIFEISIAGIIPKILAYNYNITFQKYYCII